MQQNSNNNEQQQNQQGNEHGCKVKQSYSQSSLHTEDNERNRKLAMMDDYLRGGGC